MCNLWYLQSRLHKDRGCKTEWDMEIWKDETQAPMGCIVYEGCSRLAMAMASSANRGKRHGDLLHFQKRDDKISWLTDLVTPGHLTFIPSQALTILTEGVSTLQQRYIVITIDYLAGQTNSHSYRLSCKLRSLPTYCQRALQMHAEARYVKAFHEEAEVASSVQGRQPPRSALSSRISELLKILQSSILCPRTASEDCLCMHCVQTLQGRTYPSPMIAPTPTHTRIVRASCVLGLSIKACFQSLRSLLSACNIPHYPFKDLLHEELSLAREKGFEERQSQKHWPYLLQRIFLLHK